MGKSCEFIPKVNNSEGNKVNSKLAEDLILNIGDRKDGIKTYARCKTDTFESVYGDRLQRDGNGEPTFESVYINTPLSKYIDAKQVASNYEKSLSIDEVDKFNESEMGHAFYARVEDGKVKVEILNDKSANEEAARQSFKSLNEQLRDILSQFGIEPSLLDELESNLGINGVTDFDALRNTANGLSRLIRIAKGERGEQALPEEFAHFAIRALGFNHPLVSRLLKALQSEKSQREVLGDDYERYAEEYDNNTQLIAEECAGKLVAKHLIEGKPITSSYKSIIERVIDSIKEFFSRINEALFANAITRADRISGDIAKGLLDRILTQDMSIENVKNTTGHLLQTANNMADTIQKSINRMIEIVNTKANLLEKQLNSKQETVKSARNQITGLQNAAALGNELNSIIDTVKSNVASLNSSFNILSNKAHTIPAIARQVRFTKLHIKTVVNEQTVLQNLLLYEKEKLKKASAAEQPEIEEIIDNINEVLGIIGTSMNEIIPIYKEKVKSVWKEMLAPYLELHPELKMSKEYERFMAKIDLEDIIIEDINFADRVCNSASDCRSDYVRIFDQYIKRAKEKARQKTIEFEKRAIVFGLKAERAGIKDWEFAFEKNKKGDKTGRYITDVDMALFIEEFQEFRSSVSNKEYPNVSASMANQMRQDEINKWLQDRAIITVTIDSNGKEHRTARPDLSKPLGKKYASEAYSKLTEVQKSFITEFLEMKRELDDMLPDSIKSESCIMILRDNLQRLKDANSLTDIGTMAKNIIKDEFNVRSDDTTYGAGSVADFNGETVYGVPIFYTHLKKGENMNDISTDVVSTLIAYAAMANNFDALHETVNILEVSREYITDNIRATGKRIKEDTDTSKLPYKTGENTKIVKRINDLMKMSLYGQLHADDGSFNLFGKEISIGKSVDFLNKMTALSVYALNFLGGVSNVATGIGMMNIEAVASQFFKPSDLVKADAYYGRMFPSFIAGINRRAPDDMLHLIDEKFNVLQDYGELSRDVQFRRNNSFVRLMSKSPLFVFNNAGEHWMQNRTALAVLSKYKVKRKDTGMVVSLLDALSKEPIKGGGARLSFKNIVKKDGSEFTDNDVYALTQHIQKINQRMHGIYNEADRNMMQRHAWGRMVIMFRKWMIPAWNRRFEAGRYDYDLGDTSEGYWVSTAHFIKNMVKEIRAGRSVITLYNSLSETEKRNLTRSLGELMQVAIVWLGLALLDPDTDNKSPWHKKLLEYELRRLDMELKSQLPLTAPNEIFKILKSPAASLSTAQNYYNAIWAIINLPGWISDDAIIQSGRFKGWRRNAKTLYQATPIINVVDKDFNPDYAIPFLKQSGVIF